MDVFSVLPAELVVAVAASLACPRDLLAYCAACRRLRDLPVDHLWRGLCVVRWEPWPYYRLTTDRECDKDKQSTAKSDQPTDFTTDARLIGQRHLLVERGVEGDVGLPTTTCH